MRFITRNYFHRAVLRLTSGRGVFREDIPGAQTQGHRLAFHSEDGWFEVQATCQ
jgi:hypothetical protein